MRTQRRQRCRASAGDAALMRVNSAGISWVFSQASPARGQAGGRIRVLLRHGMRALQIALGIACLAVVYTAVAPMLSAAAIASARVPAIEPPPQRATTAELYDVIAARNLFQTLSAADGP